MTDQEEPAVQEEPTDPLAALKTPIVVTGVVCHGLRYEIAFQGGVQVESMSALIGLYLGTTHTSVTINDVMADDEINASVQALKELIERRWIELAAPDLEVPE